MQRDGHLRWDLTGLSRGPHRLGAGRELPGAGVDRHRHVGRRLRPARRRRRAARRARSPTATSAPSRSSTSARARQPREELYAVNGLQFLPFNTIYQLAAETAGPLWDRAAHVVLLPDLLAYWLTGELRTETTNASTTGLLDARTGSWAGDLLDRLDMPRRCCRRSSTPGEVIGPLTPQRRADRPAAGTVVTAVGSHDTASAVVAVPATTDRFAYVSSGTWSLVGLELDARSSPRRAATANFTNEGGVDGRTRFLRNVGGLWLLQESRARRGRHGVATTSTRCSSAAEQLPPGGRSSTSTTPRSSRPGACPSASPRAHRGARPRRPPHTVRCILDSLATAYASTVRAASRARRHRRRRHPHRRRWLPATTSSAS